MFVALLFSLSNVAMEFTPKRENIIAQLTEKKLPEYIDSGIEHAKNILSKYDLSRESLKTLENKEMISKYYAMPYRKYLESLPDEQLKDTYLICFNERIIELTKKLMSETEMLILADYEDREQSEHVSFEELGFRDTWLNIHYEKLLKALIQKGMASEKSCHVLVQFYKNLISEFAEEIRILDRFEKKYPKYNAELAAIFQESSERFLLDVKKLLPV